MKLSVNSLENLSSCHVSHLNFVSLYEFLYEFYLRYLRKSYELRSQVLSKLLNVYYEIKKNLVSYVPVTCNPAFGLECAFRQVLL